MYVRRSMTKFLFCRLKLHVQPVVVDNQYLYFWWCVCLSVRMYIDMCVCVYVCMYVYMCVCFRTCTCMYVQICVLVCVYLAVWGPANPSNLLRMTAVSRYFVLEYVCFYDRQDRGSRSHEN